MNATKAELVRAKIMLALWEIHKALVRVVRKDHPIVARSKAKLESIERGAPVKGYGELMSSCVGREIVLVSNAAAECEKLAERVNTCAHIALAFPDSAIARAESVLVDAKGLKPSNWIPKADEEEAIAPVSFAVFGSHLYASTLTHSFPPTPDNRIVAARKARLRHQRSAARHDRAIACDAHFYDLIRAHGRPAADVANPSF